MGPEPRISDIPADKGAKISSSLLKSIGKVVREFGRSHMGVAGIEFAFSAPTLVFATIGVVEPGMSLAGGRAIFSRSAVPAVCSISTVRPNAVFPGTGKMRIVLSPT